MANSLAGGPKFDRLTIRKALSFLSGGVLTIGTGAQLTQSGTGKVLLTPKANPATCTVGELTVNSTGNKLSICTATNTWTVVGTQT